MKVLIEICLFTIVLGICSTSCADPIEINRLEKKLSEDKKGNKRSLDLVEVSSPAKSPVITDPKKSGSPKPSAQFVAGPVAPPVLPLGVRFQSVMYEKSIV